MRDRAREEERARQRRAALCSTRFAPLLIASSVILWATAPLWTSPEGGEQLLRASAGGHQSGYLLLALLGFQLLILAHELGHWLAARLVGMRVRRLSVGFGPALYRFERGGTLYQLSLFPLGGFVEIDGMSPLRPDPEALFWGESAAPSALPSRSARALVAIAGPAANFIVAALIYGGLFSGGASLSYQGVRLTSLALRESEGPAALAGLRAGDVLIAINGERLESFSDLRAAVGGAGADPLTVRFARAPAGEPMQWRESRLTDRCEALATRRDGGALSPAARARCRSFEGLLLYTPSSGARWEQATVSLSAEPGARGPRLGVTPMMSRFGAEGVGSAARLALGESWRFFGALAEKLWAGLRGAAPLEVSSVVRATKLSADTARLGPEWYLNLLAFISLNLCLLNLLPLPALDGGRLLLLAAEQVIGRPLPRRLELTIQALGVLSLFTLSLLLVARDVTALWGNF